MLPSCLHVTEHLDSRFGGVTSALSALCAALHETGCYHITIVAFCEDDEAVDHNAFQGIRVERFPRGRLRCVFRRDLVDRLSWLIRGADIVHIHGLWREPSSLVTKLCRLLCKPYIVSAHGMLDRWALNNKKFKKAVYAACVERPNLRRAHCLHALTHAELEDYRRFQLAVPIAVIPNGVSVPLGVGPEVFVQQYPQLQGKRLLLYMGRIHRKKGVDILCQAWLRVAPLFPDAQLVLAGPDPQNTLGSIFSLADRERLLPTVTFTGMLAGELKWSALAAASFFVLPSYSEGLSVAVLEALSMGVPVIISRQCNMPEVAATASGWIIEPDTDQLSHAISECLQKPRDEVLLMGRNAQRLARDNYSWPTIGHAMGVLYKWVLGGPRPSTVYLPGELSSFTPGQSSRS